VYTHTLKNTHTHTQTHQEIKRQYKFIHFTIKDHNQWKLPPTAGTVRDILSCRTNYTKSGSTKSFIELQTNTVKTFEHVTDCYRGDYDHKNTLWAYRLHLYSFNTVFLNNVLRYKSASASRQPSMTFFSGDARCESNWMIRHSWKQQFVVAHGYKHFYWRQKTPILNRTTVKHVMFHDSTRSGNFFVNIFWRKVCF